MTSKAVRFICAGIALITVTAATALAQPADKPTYFTFSGPVAIPGVTLPAGKSLTGLLNARAFDQRLHQEVARAARYGGPLALLILDLDGLKRINDQQGHLAGDRALQSVASAIRDELRDVDIAARLGGDEFGVLAPRTDGTAALVLGNRVRVLAAERLAAAVGQPSPFLWERLALDRQSPRLKPRAY
jgi:diguanylate cyclase (GGDEF)-like protein